MHFFNVTSVLVEHWYKTGTRYQSGFASVFQKCNWTVKIVFWYSIDKGLFPTDSCPVQKVKKTKLLKNLSPQSYPTQKLIM